MAEEEGIQMKKQKVDFFFLLCVALLVVMGRLSWPLDHQNVPLTVLLHSTPLQSSNLTDIRLFRRDFLPVKKN